MSNAPEVDGDQVKHACTECGVEVRGADMTAFGDAYIAHIRADHTNWPYPDLAIRNYAEATQRLTGPTARLESVGHIEVHAVTDDRIDDWLSFFDHDAFADNPAWAACYCAEPHVIRPDTAPEDDVPRAWHDNRAHMIERLRDGRCTGYLAYVDGRPGGWANASMRSEYALYREGPGAEPADDDVIGVACFVIAPPYRRHGLAARLLEQVLADAPGRGARFVEAYPPTEAREGDTGNFRGPRAMYDTFGFVAVGERYQNTVVRKPVATS